MPAVGRSRVIGACATVLLAAGVPTLLGGCATNAAFVGHEPDEIEGALTDAGLTICSRDETDNDLPGGVGGLALVVAAGPCPSAGTNGDGAGDEDTGVVLVEEFESEDDRDGHVRDVYLQGRLRPFTTATAFGPYTVRLSGGSAGEIVERYDRAVDLLDEQA